MSVTCSGLQSTADLKGSPVLTGDSTQEMCARVCVL